MQKPKVLLLAEQANPDYVSVPLIGWLNAQGLSQEADVHLVTQIKNREALSRMGWREGEEFTAIDSDALAKPIYAFSKWIQGSSEKGWTLRTALSLPSYYYFEYLVWKLFKKRIRAGEFDVVHRITPLSPAIPSIIAGKCQRAKVPFLLGPINGGLPWPEGFKHIQRQEGEAFSLLRGVHKYLPGRGNTQRNAAAILVASKRTWREMPKRYLDKCIFMPENGIDPEQFRPVEKTAVTLPLRVAYLGRLVPLKGLDMLLNAAAPLARQGILELDLIGDGPMRPVLREQAKALHILEHVKLDGYIPHDQVQKRLAQSQIFAFPSIRDFGGGAVLEAMAMGLIPIVLDYGGPAEIVTRDTGFIVPMGSPQQVTTGLTEVLEQMAADPAVLEAIGKRARERALTLFTWSAKAKQTVAVYDWVTGQYQDKPNFGFLGEEIQ